MRQYISLLIGLFALFSQAQPATLESGGQISSDSLMNLRVGFVDFRRIMSTVPQLKEIQLQLDKEFKLQQEDLVAAQNELKALEDQTKKISDDDDYNQIERALIAKRRDVSKKDTTLRDNYSVRRNEEITKLQRKVLDKILDLAKRENYDVILNDSGVIYVSPKADLTALVIAQMNQDSNTTEKKVKADETVTTAEKIKKDEK